MSWARLDDQFHSHPKVRRVGNAAAGCYCRCLSFCAAYHTDGFVSDADSRLFGTPREYEKLVASELLVRVTADSMQMVTDRRDTGNRRLEDVTVTFAESGYFIEDFLHYHRTGAETEALRAARIKGGKSQADERPPEPLPDKQLPSKRLADAQHPPVPPALPVLSGSKEPQEIAKPKQRDEVWDALTAVFGEAKTRSAKSLRGKVVASLKEAEATPEQIRASKAAWRRIMPPGTTFTETALEKHIGLLLAQPQAVVCPECGVGGDLHAEDCSHAPLTPASNGDIRTLMGEIHAHDR